MTKNKIKFKLTLLLISILFGICIWPLAPSKTLIYAAASPTNQYANSPSVTTEKKTLYIGHNSYEIPIMLTSQNSSILYSSSNSKIAKVSKNGVVTPVNKGSVTITVKIKQDNYNFTYEIPITVSNPYILITNKINELEYNTSHNFIANTVGLLKENIIWSSSDFSIATISSTGKLVTKSSGYVTITAKDQFSGKKSSCQLFVRPEPTNSSYFKYKISNKKAIITGFHPATTLRNVVIPSKLGGYPVTQISDYVFGKQTSIKTINFPATITSIGTYSFYGCTSLKEITLPSKLTTLGEGAFASCTALTSCVFPTKMTKISDYAFNNCTSLTEVVLPTACKTLGVGVFSASGVNELTNLQLAAYMNTDSFLDETEKQTLKEMKQILDTLISENDSDVEKVKKVHDWIIINATYDLRVYNDTAPNSSFSAEGIILNKTAVCAGYAETFSMFMALLDIECKYLVGTGNGVSHAWNSVKLDQEWYQIDVTWDDPTPDEGGISYNYFLITDKSMAKDHNWDTAKYPTATSTTYRYYAYQEDICDTSDQVRNRIEQGINDKEEWITILAPSSIALKSIINEYAYSYTYYPPYQLGDYIVNIISLK